MQLNNLRVISNELIKERYVDEEVHRTILLILPPTNAYSEVELRDAIHRHYSLNCKCCEDGCGHYFGGAIYIRRDEDVWTVRTWYTRNN